MIFDGRGNRAGWIFGADGVPRHRPIGFLVQYDVAKPAAKRKLRPDTDDAIGFEVAHVDDNNEPDHDV